MVTEQKAQKTTLFRKEALARVASPERLDQFVQVVSPQRWLSLIALGSLVVAGATWSVLGRVPITVTGRGVLAYPSKVTTVQAQSSGRILALMVQVGDSVKKGQILATIDQSELESQLKLAQEKLAQLKVQDQTATSVQTQRNSVEKIAIAQQRQTLQQSLSTVQSLSPILREKGLDAIQRERQKLQERLQTLREMVPVYKQRWEQRQAILTQGAITRDVALQAQQDYLNSQAQISEVESQLKQLDVKETDAQREYLRNVNQADELQAQMKALDSRVAGQVEQDLATDTNRQKEIQETQRLITQLEQQLKQNSQIISDYSGRVLELTAKPGQRLEPGAGIGTIAAQADTAQLMNIAFLPVSEGKKLKPGMSVQITPTTVKREELGGIKGKVKTISAYPVTQQGIASLIGNPDILPNLISEGAHLAVLAEPQTDESTPSGYRWSSSKGTTQKLTPGTTTSVRITIEERAPISFVLPILKSWTGMN
ncbi:MAG: NHLP bacteriocin system secretion protein [Leptolyngbya sp. Prado105]|nr:NHLP bacteriocin system secretion protein [Leptolyngbya sp. Prado105]